MPPTHVDACPAARPTRRRPGRRAAPTKDRHHRLLRRAALALSLGAVLLVVAGGIGLWAWPSAPAATGGPAVIAGAAAPNVSGLAWSSGGATVDATGFADWRGRPLDNTTTWPNRETWAAIADPDRYGAISRHADARHLSIGIALLPEQEPASFTECAEGRYTPWFARLGARLVELGRGDAIVRLGWEANGDWYAWAIGDQIGPYRECFRSAVTALRSTAPDTVIDWNMGKDSHMTGSVADAYPGNDVVDIIGVDFYDMYPAYPTREAWDRDYMSLQNGGPRGLGSWLAFARAHGKKLSIPEWGLNNGVGGGSDNPVFMELMHEFFTTNSAEIAYETYFNLQGPGFEILPRGINPAGSAEYRQLWRQR